MLIYHPAFDSYHCTFRLAALALRCATLDVDKARILDFYASFPSAIAAVRLPHELAVIRQRTKRLTNIYRDPVSPKRTFNEMKHVQLAALGCLAAANFLDAVKLRAGLVCRTDEPLPAQLRRLAEEFLAKDEGVIEFVMTSLAAIPTAGPDGLKARSGLLEFRYDVA